MSQKDYFPGKYDITIADKSKMRVVIEFLYEFIHFRKI